MRPKTFFIFIFFLLICVYRLQEYPLVLANGKGEYTLYLNSQSSSAKIYSVDESAKINAALIKNICGESVFFQNKVEGKSFVDEVLTTLDAVKVCSETIDGIVCDYYYSSNIYSYVLIGRKRVNLHVVYCEQGITVATPLAFGGY